MQTPALLISGDAIKEKIAWAAGKIDADYAGVELTIVMMMKGALCVVADLIRVLQTPCCIESVRASSYGQLGTKRGELKISGLDEVDCASKHILLVDDIYDSGETLTRVLAALKARNPKSLKSLVLLSKKVKRDVDYTPDYVLFEIEDLFVIGFGLDYKEHYRGLPGIYVLKES